MSNAIVRVLVSAAAIPIIISASYFGGYFFLSFVLIVSLVSFYEFVQLASKKNAYAQLTLGLISVFSFVANAYLKIIDQFFLLLLSILLLTFAELFRNKFSPLLNLGAAILGITYIGLFSSSIVSLREFFNNSAADYLKGGYLIISILASIWICDSAAYYIGTAIGKHKLFPRVSPNKSWEGSIAGFVFALAAIIIAKLLVLQFLSWFSVIGIGFIIGVFGQIGDLIESLFKRDAGVKDSSNIIPGHGGIFDRFDSLIYCAPLILLLMELLEK